MSASTVADPALSSVRRNLAAAAIALGCVEAVIELATLVQIGIAKESKDLFGGVGVEIALMAPHLVARALVMLGMSIALVVVGTALRSSGERARVAAVLWSEVAIAVLFGRIVLWEVILWPRVDNARRIVAGGFGSLGTLGSVAGDFVEWVLGSARFSEYVIVAVLLPWPMLLAWTLSRRRMRLRV